MKVEIKQIDGIALAGKGDTGHWVTMDGPAEFKGYSAATRPMELFLMGLGGCTSMDVISILQKKRVKLDHYECHLEAERAAQHPHVFKWIKIKFIFYGKDIPREACARAIELSEEIYCSASAMLKKSVDITTEYEIRESRE